MVSSLILSEARGRTGLGIDSSEMSSGQVVYRGVATRTKAVIEGKPRRKTHDPLVSVPATALS